MRYKSISNKLTKPNCMILQYFMLGAVCLTFFIFTTIKLTNFYGKDEFRLHNQALNMKIRLNQFLEAKTLKIENILNDEEFLEDKKSKKIFFLETHVDEVRILDNPRQACSVESAAITNPEIQIYFILTTNSSQLLLKYSEIAKVLLSYDNIHIRYLNIYEFSKGTTLENLIANNTILRSKFPIEHMADVMRVLILNKYGGTYLDLDVLSLVPLTVINQENFACPEGNNIVTNAVVNIGRKKHEVMQAYLQKLSTGYNPESWGANGPAMFTDSIRLFCKGVTLEKHNVTKCGDFTTFPSEKCYPIEYGGYWLFYNEKSYKNVTEILNTTKPYFLHIWNKMLNFSQQEFKLVYNKHSSYVELGKKYCPQVIKTTEKYFK